jgi:hypothetical protein
VVGPASRYRIVNRLVRQETVMTTPSSRAPSWGRVILIGVLLALGPVASPAWARPAEQACVHARSERVEEKCEEVMPDQDQAGDEDQDQGQEQGDTTGGPDQEHGDQGDGPAVTRGPVLDVGDALTITAPPPAAGEDERSAAAGDHDTPPGVDEAAGPVKGQDEVVADDAAAEAAPADEPPAATAVQRDSGSGDPAGTTSTPPRSTAPTPGVVPPSTPSMSGTPEQQATPGPASSTSEPGHPSVASPAHLDHLPGTVMLGMEPTARGGQEKAIGLAWIGGAGLLMFLLTFRRRGRHERR